MSFINITNEQYAAFVASLKYGQYSLLLGSGASTDSSNVMGNLPSGNTLRNDLCKLREVRSSASLQRVFALLKQQEIDDHVTKRFSHCTPGPTVLSLSTFVWKRAFTFNIDDAMEAAYKKPAAKQELTSLHYADDYREVGNSSELPLIHLHGYARTPDRGYVFSSEEYIQQITKINP